MTQISIRMTNIRSQKLKNIVGQGIASPYQIWTSPGATLGELGEIMGPLESRAANDQVTSSNQARNPSWLQRVCLKLGLKPNR